MSNTYRDTTNCYQHHPLKGYRDKTAKPNSSTMKKRSTKQTRGHEKEALRNTLDHLEPEEL